MSTTVEHSKVSTLSGTPKEVQTELSQLNADYVLVLTFPKVQPGVFETLKENVTNLTSSMLDLLTTYQDREYLLRLVETITPPPSLSPIQMKEAAMLLKARNQVLKSGEMIKASGISNLRKSNTINASKQPNQWKRERKIFAITYRGVDYFPLYGLDPESDYRPYKEMAEIIKAFDGHKDSWGMAYWFCSNNSFLGGKRPQDLMKTKPSLVIAAAQDEVLEISHG